MDGENNGNPELKIHDLGGFPPIFVGNTHMDLVSQLKTNKVDGSERHVLIWKSKSVAQKCFLILYLEF